MIEEGLLKKAVFALYKHEKGKEVSKPRLLEEYAKPILIQIELVKEIKYPLLKPIRIDIPNSLFSVEEDHSVCFFCRSEDKDSIDKILNDNPIAAIKTVLSLSQVKKLYVAYKDRKKLLSEHTHFFCDASIMSHIYNLLGKVFGDRNQYPAPIKLKKLTSLEGEIQKGIDSIYLRLRGKNITIQFGHINMAPKAVIENITAGINTVVQRMGGWKSIRSMHIKTNDSAALPLFSSLSNDVLNYVAKVATTTSSDNTIAKNIKSHSLAAAPPATTNASSSISNSSKIHSEGDGATVRTKKIAVAKVVNNKTSKKRIADTSVERHILPKDDESPPVIPTSISSSAMIKKKKKNSG